MLNSQLPAKWYKPFAADDGAKVEIPVTTADPTRASQSLGFPPLTMQPPEAGGVPPQGEDFNGAMNQVARIVWWLMAGGAIPYDAAFASNVNIGGYPSGSRLPSADLLGSWLSTVDNNTVNPDTVGTGWVPGYAYGVTALTGLTNANVTLTPAQALKGRITFAGTLTGNIQIILPAWTKEWYIANNTTGGSFTVTVKTAAGAGVVVPRGGTSLLRGDGTNIVQDITNIGGVASVLTSAGYIKIPASQDGRTWVVQWGTIATSTGASTPFSGIVTFPLTFPNNCLQAFTVDSGPSLYKYGTVLTNATQMTVWSDNVTALGRYLAIGW